MLDFEGYSQLEGGHQGLVTSVKLSLQLGSCLVVSPPGHQPEDVATLCAVFIAVCTFITMSYAVSYGFFTYMYEPSTILGASGRQGLWFASSVNLQWGCDGEMEHGSEHAAVKRIK